MSSMILIVFLQWKLIQTQPTCEFLSESKSAVGGPEWFQTFWEPCVNCCNKTRVGKAGDGGKWLCASKMPPTPALMSIGSNNDFSFEIDFKRRFRPRSIDVYDHTSEAHYDREIQFHKLKMHERLLRYELKRLNAVDVLKVDCEGCELELFSANVLKTLYHMNTQIQLEVHWRFLGQIGLVTLWKRMSEAGYGPYHKEPNIQYSDGSCVEYAFAPIR